MTARSDAADCHAVLSLDGDSMTPWCTTHETVWPLEHYAAAGDDTASCPDAGGQAAAARHTAVEVEQAVRQVLTELAAEVRHVADVARTSFDDLDPDDLAAVAAHPLWARVERRPGVDWRDVIADWIDTYATNPTPTVGRHRADAIHQETR